MIVIFLGCQGGDRKDCDDVTASQCYSNQTRQDCCETCDDLRIPVNIPGENRTAQTLVVKLSNLLTDDIFFLNFRKLKAFADNKVYVVLLIFYNIYLFIYLFYFFFFPNTEKGCGKRRKMLDTIIFCFFCIVFTSLLSQIPYT